MTEASDGLKAQRRTPRTAVTKIGAAVALAVAFCLGAYLLLEATRPETGAVSFTFLLILPAAVSAFVAYVADPWAERTRRTYLLVPVWLLLAVIVGSVFVLREGAVCVVLLAPLWLGSGVAGSALTYGLRRRLKRGRTYSSALLLLPMAGLLVEPLLPVPATTATVTRSIVVEASTARLWPLVQGISDIQPDEGRWNITQDLLGVPRPLESRLVGEGRGSERLASWGKHIHFREPVTEWRPQRRIGWRFVFDDLGAWDSTDRHLQPDSSYFRVTTGGYTLTPLGRTRTRVTLDTQYWIKTPVNLYSTLWGELFLGDLENNLLALLKQRAEDKASPSDADLQ